MMHVISIPYALMKVNPLSWIQKVCQYKGSGDPPPPPPPTINGQETILLSCVTFNSYNHSLI